MHKSISQTLFDRIPFVYNRILVCASFYSLYVFIYCFFCRCLCRYEYNYHVFVWSISSNRWLDAHALPGWARPDVCATYIWVGPGPAVGGVCALNAFTGVYFAYASAHRCGFIISNYSVPFKIIWAWPALRGIIEGACAGRARTDYGFYGESTHKRQKVCSLNHFWFGGMRCPPPAICTILTESKKLFGPRLHIYHEVYLVSQAGITGEGSSRVCKRGR